MRHRVKGRKFGRLLKHRRSMFKNQMTSLILHDSITTTEAKAKELRSYVDSLLSAARTLEPYRAVRKINANLFSAAACRKVMEVLRERYKDRTSGYTRIHRIGNRPNDGARIVKIELV